jgi:heterodisulfide reductase subunit A
MMEAEALVIGGGVTGMQVALGLGHLGRKTLLVERADRLGGRVPLLATTFPFFSNAGFNDGAQFAASLERELRASPTSQVRLQTSVCRVDGEYPRFSVTLSDGSLAKVAVVIVCTGFEPFNPAELPEYAYGVCPNVVTASELEWLLNPRGPHAGVPKRPSDGRPVQRLALVFCVGSRNRKIGAPFCSRICCSYSTKQALTFLTRNPRGSVACFYMDVRTYDRGFEEMYNHAQERGVRYIRGRVSGCKQLPDGSVLIRAENTLLQRPFTGEFDLVSLSTGMRPARGVAELAQILCIERARDGFFSCGNWFRLPNDSTRPGILLAGCATGMKPIKNCMTDATAAAARAVSLLLSAELPASRTPGLQPGPYPTAHAAGHA